MISWRTICDWVTPPFDCSAIVREQAKLAGLSDHALRNRSLDLRDAWFDGRSTADLATTAFALVREAARRCLGIEHRENQLRAAWHLLRREIVELPTGEGKTLAATPALAVRAMAGRGAWLATSNDYLARRDAERMQPVFELLGLSTGYLQVAHTPAERRAAYACDITYGTIREFGFDDLRDRLAQRRGERPLQRPRFSLLVDEADSILLDDARTPLIISEPRSTTDDEQLVRWSVAVSRTLTEEADYLLDPLGDRLWLTEQGRAAIRRAAPPELLQHSSLPEAYESVARALHAERTFRIDRDFVVQQGKIAVLDHPTGRIAAGRQWPHGIQQSLEAAQGLELTPEFRPAAQITVQRFLSGFPHLSGMTGTAREAARELELQFGLHTVVVAPHRPCRRMELPAVVTDTRLEKWERVLDSVRHQHAAGRPILIGTRDLPASEELSDRLRSAGFRHQLLTARQEAEEAQLIARAGERGMITVSTNIAGRGTDIRLGAAVAELGGLHVIAADLFDAARIDRQLAGRGGRQGDPATYQKIVSLEDAVLAAAWDQPTCRRKVRRATSRGTAEKLDTLRQAQTALEQRHAAARRQLLAKDREHSQRSRTLGLDPSLDDPDA